jgi:uncharacterized protein
MSFQALANHRYISLATFRRSGDTVKTAVWFANRGAELVVGTFATSGKIKRVRHTPQVSLAPATFRGREVGPAMVGTARTVDGLEAEAARKLLAEKYGWQWKVAGRRIDAFLAISPE